MSLAGTKICLEALDIKTYFITKLKMAGIESIFDLAISLPHQLVDVGGGMRTGTDEHVGTLRNAWRDQGEAANRFAHHGPPRQNSSGKSTGGSCTNEETI
jgi:hypothetical protein